MGFKGILKEQKGKAKKEKIMENLSSEKVKAKDGDVVIIARAKDINRLGKRCRISYEIGKPCIVENPYTPFKDKYYSISGGPFTSVKQEQLVYSGEVDGLFWKFKNGEARAYNGEDYTERVNLFYYVEYGPAEISKDEYNKLLVIRTRISKDYKISDDTIGRGKYIFTYGNKGWDFHAKKINANPFKTAIGYIIKDCGSDYKYIIYQPGSWSGNWIAFYTMEKLLTFVDAYDIKMEISGNKITLTMPKDDRGYKELI